jgi:hypothetical protein
MIAYKKAYTVLNFIISWQQYLVAHCLNSYVSNVFGLHSICFCLPSTHELIR